MSKQYLITEYPNGGYTLASHHTNGDCPQTIGAFGNLDHMLAHLPKLLGVSHE